LLLLFFVATFFGALFAARGHLLLPRVLIVGVRLFRGAINTFGSLFGDPHLADHAGIAAINAVNRKKFLEIPEPVVVMPQCLRRVDCPSRIDPRRGIVCRGCGRCVIGRLIKEHPQLKVFIVPGGTFAARIVKQQKPRSVLGVACANDLYEGMLYCFTRKIPVQGIELLRDGCVETAVDEKRLFGLLARVRQTVEKHK